MNSEEEERIHQTLSLLSQDKEKLEQEKDLIQKKSENSETTLRTQLKEVS
jgi:hypothetical protein